MYLSFAAGLGCLALYPLAGSLAVAMGIGAVEGLLFALGDITWATMMQSHVPREMLGRVSAVDYMVSFGLVPISFALAGPAAALFGVEETMIGAGVLAALVFVAFLLVPGVRAPERWAVEERARAEGAG
jgi:DHA3 family tetracycline resistance protein-like MFS transporter